MLVQVLLHYISYHNDFIYIFRNIPFISIHRWIDSSILKHSIKMQTITLYNWADVHRCYILIHQIMKNICNISAKLRFKRSFTYRINAKRKIHRKEISSLKTALFFCMFFFKVSNVNFIPLIQL